MNSQKVIEIQETETLDEAVAKTGLAPRALILLLGDYDPMLHGQVRSICSRVIGPLALKPGALVIDDGAQSGCAAAMGAAARDHDDPIPLLGIAAAGEVDANHPLILRLPAAWTDDLKYRVQLVGKLARDSSGREKPVLAILVGGKDAHVDAVLRCNRYGWPILLIQGSGGLADRIALAMQPPAEGSPPVPIADPDLREIIDTAIPDSFSLGGNMDDLERILLARIELRADTLADAWSRFDDLDVGANIKHLIFQRLQGSIMILAIVATLVAILSLPGALPPALRALMPASLAGLGRNGIHILVILAPITVSVLVACNNRFREGNKWVLLRASAEGIKREIFRYRAQAGVYSGAQCKQVSRESKLAGKIKDITSSLAQSEVNKTSLPHQTVADPERLKFLDAEGYLENRLQEQIGHLMRRTASLYRQLKRTQVFIYVAGGLGTFLAAMGGDPWVALTTAFAGVWTTKLETDQVENSLLQYNQALISLRNIESWWKALSQWEKGRSKNIDLLVDQTEKTLEGELAGWVQQMQTTLDKLTEKESELETKRQTAQAS